MNKGAIVLSGRRKVCGQKALSLIETILAASVLSMVMMILFNLYPSSMLAVRKAEHRLQATAMAQSLLEFVRAQSFNNVLAIMQQDSNLSPSMTGTPPSIQPGQWTQEYIVYGPASSPTPAGMPTLAANTIPSPPLPPAQADDGTLYWVALSVGLPSASPAPATTPIRLLGLRAHVYYLEPEGVVGTGIGGAAAIHKLTLPQGGQAPGNRDVLQELWICDIKR